MRNLGGVRVIVAGMAGIFLGMLAEPWINQLVGRTVIVDGMLWGAVLSIFIASIPNFARMGSLTVKSSRPAVNFIVGVGLFLVISFVIMAVFFLIFWLLSRILL